MNQHSHQTGGPCLSDAQIQFLLTSDSSQAEDDNITDHLGRCETCQQRIQHIVTKGEGWQDWQKKMEEFPDDVGLNTTDSGQFSEIGSEFSTTRLKKLLAPTENPRALGKLGRFEIEAIIGQGGTGIVFRAFDQSLNRNVAVKLLTPGFSHVAAVRNRFEREGRAIAAVRDPQVIEVYGVDEYDGLPYIVMQYVPDGSLQKRLDQEGQLPPKEICRIALQIAKGLVAAHRQGIVHRDIKPANILLEDGTGRAIVTDFGLARVADEATVTCSGTIAGTPQYMSPEQACGKPLDFRSDLFSLGSVMYTMATGSTPFDGETLMGVVHKVCNDDPLPVRQLNPDIPRWLEAFIVRLLAKNAADRFQSAKIVVEILEGELAYLQTPSALPRPKRPWLSKERTKVNGRNRILKSLALFLTGFFVYWAISSAYTSGWFAIPNSATTEKSGISKRSFSSGIVPTEQEENYFRAKAAYDLAYETHLSERGLHGDMRDAIAQHKAALKLGYDRAQTSYLLARAYALEGNEEECIAWMNKAMKAGFFDYLQVEEESDFKSFKRRKGFKENFKKIIYKLKQMKSAYLKNEKSFFKDKNYKESIKGYSKWLKSHPNDDRTIMMLGASLLENRSFDQADTWAEKTRKTIRFSDYGSYNLACVYAQRGDLETAFQYLEHAVQVGFTDYQHMKKDHQLTPLRQDDRFKKLLSRAKKKGLSNDKNPLLKKK